MTNKNRLFLCALGAVVAVGATLQAADPARPSGCGKVLLLENERLIEGDIERVGEQYRVRRSVGETWVPGDKVLHLCASLEDAYAYLRSQANLDDADEHLRLAQWCQVNGLREQALAEVTAAVKLRPDHAPSRRLLNNLQQAATPAVGPAQPNDKAEPEQPATPVDLDAESLSQFGTRVQPILMNACVSCHASGRGGSFKIQRIYGSASTNRKTTQQNLAAVVAQINAEHPETSPLLIKAASKHSDMEQAPLRGRQMPAYRTLEDWVRSAVANNPQLREQARATVAAASAPQAKPELKSPESFAASKQDAAKEEHATPARNVPVAPVSPPPAEQATVPLDPFDPMVFNRQMHPNRKVPGQR